MAHQRVSLPPGSRLSVCTAAVVSIRRKPGRPFKFYAIWMPVEASGGLSSTSGLDCSKASHRGRN